MIIAAFSPKVQSFLWLAAVVSYVFAAVSGFFGHGERRTEAIAFIAAGLFLWHIPALWDLLDSAW